MGPFAAERRPLRYAEARERVLAAARPLPAEQVPLAEALGRPLRDPVTARHPLPPFRNSAMDGIAVRSADLARASRATPVILTVIETVPAGRVATLAMGAGEAIRIMTGAMLPEGADAVVPVEEIEFLGGAGGEERVRVARPCQPGDHVREAGLDLAAGEVAIEAGRALTPHDLALLAALGVARPTVGRRPHAAVISTGDELVAPEAALAPGAIRDSNLPMLEALIAECGGRVVSAKRVGDDPALVGAQLRAALGSADVVITVGGVSAGDFDPVKGAIADLEGIELWRVAMRPGQPQAFGVPDGRLFFGLPGNPASVACVFEGLVRPALRKLQGFVALDRPRIRANAAVVIESREHRTDFVRVTLARRDGSWWATPVGAPVSGHLAPQSRAHALLVIPDDVRRLDPGEPALALLLRWPEEDPA
ncbi:MAG: molybdopterin molybdotransferase MoeA [Candidatus Eiseniibacteriota bacterium]